VRCALENYSEEPGWVEQDPLEIGRSQLDCAREALAAAGVTSSQVAAIGITNQRETTVVWDRRTGEPVCNAIVWQDRRTAAICDRLKSEGLEALFTGRTGLVLDAYFSGTKLRWVLDHVTGARALAEVGALCFGTVDSWLIWNLTGGRVHVTDASNASRTLLYNIHNGLGRQAARVVEHSTQPAARVVDSSGRWRTPTPAGSVRRSR
jgi:glycerol kinase